MGKRFFSVRRAAERQPGFTLIELLIVIAILGVLSGIAVFAVGGFQDMGKDEACKTDKQTLVTALEAFKAKYKGYPENQAGLVSAQFLREPSTRYNFTPADGTTPPSVNVTNEAGASVLVNTFKRRTIASVTSDCP